MDEHDWQYMASSLGRHGALHTECMVRCVAAHIHPSKKDGGPERVHALLQHVFWSGVGAGRDLLVCRLVVICCSLSCCCAMLRSSEMRLRRLSVRQGLVVTEVWCVGSVSVAAVAATGRGGDDSGVYAVGEEDAESCVSIVCGAARFPCANRRSLCWRAAAWYSCQVRGLWVRMFSVRMM